MSFRLVLCLMGAGGIGALTRFLLGQCWISCWGKGFPTGTLIINLTGCFLFGLLSEYFEIQHQISPEVRLTVLTGFLGAFTTFSTFIYESERMFREGLFWQAFCNFTLQNVLGFGLLCFGVFLMQTFCRTS